MVERIDAERWSAVAAYLAGKGHVLDWDVEIHQLSGGSANYNYLISMDGCKSVLRCPPEGPLPPGANDVAREYKVLSSLGDAFPAAPRGLVFCDDETIIGSPFCISQFREGICIGRNLPPILKDVSSVGENLSELVVSTLAQLHGVDVCAVDLADLGSADGFLERQISGWFKRGQRVLSEEQMTNMERAKAWLSSNLPKRRMATLVHNDFKLDNMLINPRSLAVTGVVDWDMCTIGDPLFELAVVLAYWGGKNDPGVYAYQCRMPCESEGWWTRWQVIERYQELTGFDVTEDELAFYWWLCQYRNVVVYAQLNALFERTGQRPAALTQSECDGMSAFVDDLSKYIGSHIGAIPEILR